MEYTVLQVYELPDNSFLKGVVFFLFFFPLSFARTRDARYFRLRQLFQKDLPGKRVDKVQFLCLFLTFFT